VLRKDLPSPLIKESDEEKLTPEEKRTKERNEKEKDKKGVSWMDDEAKPGEKTGDKPSDKDKPGEEKPKTPPPAARVTIDRDGIEFRILDLPIPAADISNLQAGGPGQIFYVRESDEKKALQRFDLKDRKAETLLPDVAGYEISADTKKLLYRVKDAWAITSAATKKVDPSEGKV
jgi:tricorn protease